MPKFIIKLNGYYLEWSTVTDSPVTFGMGLEEFKAYYWDYYGIEGMTGLPARLERVERAGTSSFDGRGVDDLISFNRAGPDETRLTKDEIYRAYCLQEPIKDGWKVPCIDDEREVNHENR